MTKIIALDAQTGKTLATLNNRGKKVFFNENYSRIMKGKHAFIFTMLATNPKSQHFSKNNRLLVQIRHGVFEEFTIFHTFTNMRNEKTITAVASYSSLETAHIIEPGKYTGTLQKIATDALAPTKYDLGLFEDFGQRTIQISEPVGAYSFLIKLASEFNQEMDIRIEMKGNKFTSRYVDFVKRIGPDLKDLIEYGENLTDIEMQEHTDRIATRLIGMGPIREDGSYLTSIAVDEEAFQRWNDEGTHITKLYRPETNDQNMTQARLDQLTKAELKKRIDSVVEYKVTAAFIKGAMYGSSLRVKNPRYVPPLYADARVIGVEGPLVNNKETIYTIGEVKTYSQEDILRTFKQLQAQYNMRVVRSAEKPPGSPNKIWIQIVPAADGKPAQEVPHIWSTELNDWVKIAPTTAAEIGAETPAGAQEKANVAEQAAKNHAEQKDTEQAQIINQTINQTRINLETDLAAKAGLNYVDGKFSLIDSDLSAMLGDINLITGDVSGITSQVDGLQQTANDLQTQVGLNEEALLAGNGRMTTIETDVNDLEGTMSATITQLSNLDGKVTNQQTQINANAEAITLKASQTSLDTLTGEVSDINAELTVQAGQIALKASAEALTTVDNKVTGLQSDVSSLVVDVDGITSSVTSLRTDFDGLSIGGRNLFLNTAFKGANNWTLYTGAAVDETYKYKNLNSMRINQVGATVNNFPGFLQTVSVEGIDKLNFSSYIFSKDISLDDAGFFIRFNWVGGTVSYTDLQLSPFMNANEKWIYVSASIQVPPGATSSQIRINFRRNGNAYFSNLKLEKGNKATTWTPAPEDVDLSISNVQQYASSVNQKADSIISDVTALRQTVNGHTTSISNAQSSITQLSNSVALKAEKTQVDSIGGQVTNVSNDVSQLKVDVTGITSNVSSLRSDLTGLKIGGRNLLENSLTMNRAWDTHPNGSYNYFLRADMTTVRPKVKLGEQITISFDVEMEFGTYLTVYDSNGNTDLKFGSHIFKDIGSGKQRLSFTKTLETGTGTQTSVWRLDFYNGNNGDKFSIKNIKIEKGNKATDWTPAPEDIDSRVSSAESNITQLAGQISSKVSTTDYTGNKIASLINQTATTISIQASKINLVGAVNVLSEISGELGNITAGTISGVTFTSVMGKKSFNLSNGLAEFIEDRSAAGVPLETRTAINEDGMKIQNSSYNEVDYTANLTAQVLSFAGYQGYQPTEYAADRIEMLQGSTSEFGIYPNASLATIQSTGPIELVAGAQKLTLFDNTLRYNGAPIGFSGSEILWSGALYMRDGQSVTPTRKLVDCPSGWILVWSRYVNGAAAGSDWNFTIVPKMFADIGGGSWHALPATGSGSVGVAPPVAYKYIYASSTQLLGHTRNDDGSESGQVLRYVLAF